MKEKLQNNIPYEHRCKTSTNISKLNPTKNKINYTPGQNEMDSRYARLFQHLKSINIIHSINIPRKQIYVPNNRCIKII